MIDNYSLDIIGRGDIPCQHGRVVDVYHVPSLNVNLLLVSKLTQTSKIVEFYPNPFFVKDINNENSIVAKGSLNLKDHYISFMNCLEQILDRLLSFPRLTNGTKIGMNDLDT